MPEVRAGAILVGDTVNKEEMHMAHELLIIGGGASGLMAAIAARDMGMDAAIIESNDRIGKKILTTGNGRCNITNETIAADIERHYHCCRAGFPVKALQAFTVRQTVDFFQTLGLPLTTLDGGKMYPLSLQASSVLDIFRLALEERGVPQYFQHKAVAVALEQDGFAVHCRTEEGMQVLHSKKLLLCTGGKAAPQTGSDGSGYALAQSLGHRLVTPVPALVQLKLDYKHLKALSGIKFEGQARIWVNGRCEDSQAGEILFTDYGISGPPVLSLSRVASLHLKQGAGIHIAVDMMPGKTEKELEDFLENHWGLFGHRSAHDAFVGIVHKKLIPTLLKEAGVSELHKPCWDLDWKEKKTLLRLLKNWEFPVTDTNSFTNAQVTAGGIDTADVNPETLESKLVPGLYLAGEVLDVDGDCGGYNLQWAWSSGYVAARSCAERRS